MTGKRVWSHQVYHLDSSKPVNSHSENLPLMMKNNGYTTMAFVLNKKHASPKTLGIFNSFSIVAPTSDLITSVSWLGNIDEVLYEIFGDKIRLYDWLTKRDFIVDKIFSIFSRGHSVTGVPPEKAFDSFLKTIDNKSTSPFFVWIHLYPPHDPYLPTNPYIGMFDSSSRFRTNISQREVLMQSTAAISRKYPTQQVQVIVDSLKARYDEFIRYCDKQFEEFIEELNVRSKLMNTVIILSADHGETFEHGYVGHNSNLYEQETHIPLIIREPDQVEGRIIHDLIDQVDIPATILDLAGIQIPVWMEGRSIVPLMRGERLSARPAFSMNFMDNYRGHEIANGKIAVWQDDYKIIHYLKTNKSRLYNLKKDPNELVNLMDKEPEIGKHLLSLIKVNIEKANEKIRKGE
jgi:arylsulfatase A-like enzyme